MGYPEKFAPSALRLANNSLDQAAVLVQKMTGRAAELEKGDGNMMPPLPSSSSSASLPISLSYSLAGEEVLTHSTHSNSHRDSRDTNSHGHHHTQSNKSIDTAHSADTLLSDEIIPHYSPRSGGSGSGGGSGGGGGGGGNGSGGGGGSGSGSGSGFGGGGDSGSGREVDIILFIRPFLLHR